MKRKTAVFGIVFSLLILFGFGSCDVLLGPDEPVNPVNSAGNLVISLGAGPERAISSGADLPGDLLASLRYELTLTGPGGEVLNRTVMGVETLSIAAALGEWRITARAYKEDGLAGTGSLTFTVGPGNNAIKVPMNINGGFFDITAAPMSNGTVTADCEGAFPGTTVTLTVAPDPGYGLKAGTLKYNDGSDHGIAGPPYTFAMPVADITVSADFEGVYSISGIITTNDPGGPAAGANVQLKQGVTDVGNAVTTEADGTYTITGVPPGTGYTIEVSMTAYTTGTIPLFDVTGDVTDKALELVKYVEPVFDISGTITTDNPGGAVGGASVQLKQGGSLVGNVVNTAVDGTYTITDVPAGNYTIDVSMTGYTPNTISSVTVTSADVTDQDLTLIRIVYTVSGTITTDNPSGGLANGADVQLKQGGSPVGSPVSTAADGTYTITDVPAGDYTIDVSLAEYTTGTILSFNVAGGVTGKNLTLVRIVYTISGTITTDNPGGAANGASVQLKQGGSDVGSPVTTAANGTYTITNVLPGNGYTIEVSMTGYTTGTSSSFNVAGGVTGKDLILARIVCTVTFNADNGTADQAASVGEGDKVAKPAAPVKTGGYIFAGWYKEPGLSSQWNFNAIVMEDMTLYARWIPFKMVPVPVPAGGITFPTGIDDLGSATVASAYEMGETEVTYELWYAVRTWAEDPDKGYTFLNPGLEGKSGETAGAAPTAAKQEPVTKVSWFDTVVWLNALTEWVNENTGSALTPVYYYDNTYASAKVAKNSTPTLNFVKEDASYWNASAYAKSGATGFRLPTSDEWELAARWRNDSTNTVSGPTYPWFTKGDSASGAQADTTTAATDVVAWYKGTALDNKTHAVKGLAPNSLGLYDMSGNVSELCFDWHPDTLNNPNSSFKGRFRIRRGGTYGSDPTDTFMVDKSLQMGSMTDRATDEHASDTGFRPARTAP